MADTPKKMVPVKVKHSTSGKVKVINPEALERYEKAGYAKVEDEKPSTADKAGTSAKGGN